MELGKSVARLLMCACFLGFTFTCTAQTKSQAAPSTSAPNPAQIQNRLAGFGLPFEVNEGQFDSRVAFAAHTPSSTLFVTRNGDIVHAFPGPPDISPADAQRQLRTHMTIDERLQAANDRVHQKFKPGWALIEKLVGANTMLPSGNGASPTRITRFDSKDMRRSLRNRTSYEHVELGESWPGIRVDLHASGNAVEKIFTVAPKANPDRIGVQIDGAQFTKIESDGTLAVGTGNGPVHFTKPLAYQDIDGRRQVVPVSYRLSGSNTYGFQLGTYDHSRAVVIDPILQSTYVGIYSQNSSDLAAPYVRVDGDGNVLVVSETLTTSFPPNGGGAYPTQNALVDTFAILLSGDLRTILRATFFGTSTGNMTYPTAIDIDAGGNILVLSITSQADLPWTADGVQPVPTTNPISSPADQTPYGLVAKLSPDLSSIGGTYLTGNGPVLASQMSVDRSGGVYAGDIFIVGQTAASDLPNLSGAVFPTIPAAAAGSGATSPVGNFITRLRGDLTSYEQSTYLGNNNGMIYSIAVDGSGALFVAGEIYEPDISYPATQGAFDTTPDNQVVYLAKLSESLTGSLLAATYLGDHEMATAMSNVYSLSSMLAIDSQGDVYVTGNVHYPSFGVTTFPGTDGGGWPYTPTNSAGVGFISKLKGDLSDVLQSTFVGTQSESTYEIRISPVDNDIYVCGYANYTDFNTYPNYPPPITIPFSGSLDGMLARFSPDLTVFKSATYIGGTGREVALSFDFDKRGRIVVAGGTTSTDFPNVAGGMQPIFGGAEAQYAGSDEFVTLLTQDLAGQYSLAVSKSQPTPSLIAGQPSTYTITVTNNTNYYSGNVNDPDGISPVDALAARVEDQLPDGVNFVGAVGDNWTCANANGLVTCDFVTGVNPDGSAIAIPGNGGTSAITVTVVPTQPGTVVNYVSLDASGSINPPVPASCTDVDTPNVGCGIPVTSVVQQPTTTALSASPNPGAIGQAVTLTAAVQGNNPSGGTVDFAEGQTVLCSAIPLSNGTASCSATLSAGEHNIIASYSGAGEFGASVSSPLTLTIKDSATITIAASPNPATALSPVSVSVSVAAQSSGDSNVPGGAVILSDGTTDCSVNLASPSACTFTPQSTAALALSASYSGDTNFVAGTSTTSVPVNPAPTTTTLLASPASSVYGQSVTLTATVAGGGMPTGGAVSFADSATTLCASVPLANGQATCSVPTSLSVGAHNFTAVYGGTDPYAGSTSAALAFTVNKASTTTIAVAAPTSINLGSPVTVSVSVGAVAPGVGTPTGNVAVRDGSNSCTITLPQTSCSLTPTSKGNLPLTATYSGDTNFNGSQGATLVGVGLATTTTTLVASPSSVSAGQTVTFTATVSGGSAPTGAVNFLDGASAVCTATLAGSTATCSSSTLTAGAHSVIARYQGDNSNATSSSAPASVTVGKASATLTVTVSPSTVTAGSSVSVNIVISPADPQAGTPSGTVNVSGNGLTCTITLPATSCSLKPTAAGTYTLAVTYPGDSNFAAAQTTATLTVNPPIATLTATTTKLTASPNPARSGQTLQLVATVSESDTSSISPIRLAKQSLAAVTVSASAVPGGSVTFSDGGTPLGTVALNDGTAPLVTSSLSSGTHIIAAAYSGDATHSASSGTLSVVIDPAVIVPSAAVPAPLLGGRWSLLLLFGVLGAGAWYEARRRARRS